MLALPGSGALSPFRRKQLLSRLQAREPGVQELSASFLHLVEIKPWPEGAHLARLRELLNYGPDWPQPELGGSEEVLLASAPAGQHFALVQQGHRNRAALRFPRCAKDRTRGALPDCGFGAIEPGDPRRVVRPHDRGSAARG